MGVIISEGIFIPIILFISFGGFIIWYGVRQNQSIIERARKIDPSVKTVTEAHYVLRKDIAESFGKDSNNKK